MSATPAAPKCVECRSFDGVAIIDEWTGEDLGTQPICKKLFNLRLPCDPIAARLEGGECPAGKLFEAREDSDATD